jgi:hypothetical protein
VRLVPIATGALALAGLQLAVGSSSTRVAGLFGSVAGAVRWWLSPLVPAIPDHRVHGAPSAVAQGGAVAGSTTAAAATYPSPSTSNVIRT